MVSRTEGRFWLKTGRILICLECTRRTAIDDRPGALQEAQDTHRHGDGVDDGEWS